METHALIIFSATVVPLVCTPGPDILFIASQAVSGGARAGLRAIAGICLGYLVHFILVALGLAAVVAASPVLFEVIRWIGIIYLVYLAYNLVRSAFRTGGLMVSANKAKSQLSKGFVTSLLNPKGMMIYVAILPQFMDKHGSVTMQAAILSATFISWCALIYTIVAFIVSAMGSKVGLSDRRRRIVDGCAGGMILMAAGFLAAA
jgi:threonine/homoserine/homoserine lactone efflux protein